MSENKKMETTEDFERTFAKRDGRCVHEWYELHPWVKGEVNRGVSQHGCRKCPAIGNGSIIVDNPVCGSVGSLIDYADRKGLMVEINTDYNQQKNKAVLVRVFPDNDEKPMGNKITEFKDHPSPSEATRHALMPAIEEATRKSEGD